MNEDVNLLLQKNRECCPVLHILVVGFHHQRGAEVEFVYPAFTTENLEKGLPIPWKPLLHLALPDGAHNFDEDFVFFKLPCTEDCKMTQSGKVFGVACFQQIASKELKVKEDDVTRTSVQKKCCDYSQNGSHLLCAVEKRTHLDLLPILSYVKAMKSYPYLSGKPLFGFVLSKLSLVTKAYFGERDFSKTNILKDTYLALNHSLSSMKPNDAIFHMGLSLKDLVSSFSEKVLVLFKLLLLERKVVFWGVPAGKVSKSILSLVSIFPGQGYDINQGNVFGELCLSSSGNFFKTGLDDLLLPREKEDPSSKDQYGLPMDLFDEEYIFHPYLSLQQMNLLKCPDTKGFLVGASNVLYKRQAQWDVLVDLESNDITIPDTGLSKMLSLTIEDLRFTEFISTSVAEHDADSGIAWDGSDDWIRIQFKYYLLCLLASVAPEKGNFSHINRQFNEDFITAWKQTRNFRKWCETRHLGLENIHLGHPFEGSLTISDIRLRIRSRLGSVTLSDDSREKIGAAVQKTGQAFGMAFNSAKTALNSWKGWFTGIVQEINDEMNTNSRNIDFVNSNEQEVSPSNDEFSYGMTISNRERTGRK